MDEQVQAAPQVEQPTPTAPAEAAPPVEQGSPEATAEAVEKARQPDATPESEAAAKAKLEKAERFVAARKREREYREKEAQWKQAEAELAEHRRLRELAKTDPIAAMEALGHTYEGITKWVLDNDKYAARDPTPAELAQKAVREELDRMTAAQKDAYEREQTRMYETAKTNVLSEAARLAKAHGSDGGRYELINLTGAHELVWEHCEAEVARTGRGPSIEEAADAVEAKLAEYIAGIQQKSRKLAPKRADQGRPTTLTNRQGAEVAGSDHAHLDDDERLRVIVARHTNSR